MRNPQAGFTLVEVLTSIVILVFGLVAVTNLLLVGASSNIAANQGTAATAMATQMMEQLKFTSWPALTPGGSVTSDVGTTATSCLGTIAAGVYNCNETISGVGTVHMRWRIAAVPGQAQLLFIAVRAEGTGALARSRSRSDFTTLRSCTDTTTCPVAP